MSSILNSKVGLLDELKKIIDILNKCICCGKTFKSKRCCKSHMRAVNHCKLRNFDPMKWSCYQQLQLQQQQQVELPQNGLEQEKSEWFEIFVFMFIIISLICCLICCIMIGWTSFIASLLTSFIAVLIVSCMTIFVIGIVVAVIFLFIYIFSKVICFIYDNGELLISFISMSPMLIFAVIGHFGHYYSRIYGYKENDKCVNIIPNNHVYTVRTTTDYVAGKSKIYRNDKQCSQYRVQQGFRRWK